jgi:hypothetical protein
VIPFIGNSNATGGFIDTGQRLEGWDPHVYVSVQAAEEMARFLGWQPAVAESAQLEKVRARDVRIAELEAEVAELERFRDAAEYTLSTIGQKVRAKPGRKVAA